jgi:hypothetical protein
MRDRAVGRRDSPHAYPRPKGTPSLFSLALARALIRACDHVASEPRYEEGDVEAIAK